MRVVIDTNVLVSAVLGGQLAEVITRWQVVAADSKDDKFIEAAVAGGVDIIVSGDKHLLSLGAYRAIPIITARTFLEQLASTQD